MADHVVTVPQRIWFDWINEGDAAGEPESGEEWGWFMGIPLAQRAPDIGPGDRLYIVGWGRIRGYSLVTRVVREAHRTAICRRGGAVAVTIPETGLGFRGCRRRWWERDIEVPFPSWRTEGVNLAKAQGGRWPKMGT